MQQAFWSFFLRVWAGISVSTAALLLSIRQEGWAVSFMLGVLVGMVTILLIRMTVASCARTGLSMASGGKKSEGKLFRILLFWGRLFILALAIQAAIAWKNINVLVFTLGLCSFHVAIPLSVLMCRVSEQKGIGDFR